MEQFVQYFLNKGASFNQISANSLIQKLVSSDYIDSNFFASVSYA